SAAIAQQDPIKARKDLMKANGDQAKIGAAMVKGDKPFDLAAVHKIFATFEDAAAKMPALFPDSSKSEANSPEADDFSPTPKVWEDMADFKARFVKFGHCPPGGVQAKSVRCYKGIIPQPPPISEA